MPLRLVQVVGDFKDNRNLGGKGASTANVLLGNAGFVETIKHPKHAEHFPIGAQQRNRQQLPRLVLRENLQVRAGQLPDVIGPEDFFCAQGAGGDALRENGVHAPRLTPRDGTANPKLLVFKEGDEAPAIAEKVGGAHHESPEEMLEVSTGTELGRDLE